MDRSTSRRELAEHTSPWLAKMPNSGHLRRVVEAVAVGEHQVRALAAALQPHRLCVRLTRVAEEELAHFGGPGERDAIDVVVKPNRAAGCLAEARHDVERAIGEPGGGCELG